MRLCIGLSSCTNENDNYLLNQSEEPPVASLRQAADGKYDLLGFGYDITGDYLHVDEARYSVLDIDAFVAANSDRFYYPATTIGSINTYSGATATDFLQEIQTKTSVKGGLSVGAVFSGSVTNKKESQTKYSYSDKYSFSRGDVIKRVKRLYLNTDVAALSKYVKNTFKEDLNKYSADVFVKMYGTHVLTDITIGGRLSFTYKSVILEESNYSRKKDIVEGGLKFTIGKFGADGEASHEKETIKQLNTKNASWNTQVDYFGGEGSGVSLTFNSETGYPTTTFNLDSWEKSVNDKNAALVDINWDRAYPIYEFVSDPIKKAQIKAAVEKYINSKKIVVDELVLLHQYWNGRGNDHFYTLEKTPTQGGGGWVYEYPVCFVPKNNNSGMVPFHRYWNGTGNDHYYELGKAPIIGGGGWVYETVACYVFKTNVQGTVPLHRYWSGRGSDHFYTLEKAATQGGGGWVYETVSCYVYPLK